MRRANRSAFAVAAVMLGAGAGEARGQDESRTVAGGGITVPGWTGKADGGAAVNGAKFVPMGNGFHVTTGPAVTYWNPANRATGNYTVKATFTEPKYMSLNNHPHPYGIVIGGNDLGTDNQSLLYCMAYGNGTFIVRGFAPAPFRVSGARGEPNAAIKKAAAQNEAVTNEVALSVRGDKVECSVNGTVVGSYNKADVVGAGKLKSTDGIVGLRFGHNTDVHVEGFALVPAVSK